jgi:hypothetical protein
MNSLVLFTLWLLTRPQGGTTSPQIHNQNIVRICSLAPGTPSSHCQDLDARLLEPAAATAPIATATAGGLRAFIDPETKSLVQPTQDQLQELSVALSESMDKRQEDVKAVVLPNGTLRLPGGSFTLYSKAVVETEKKP